MHFNCYDSFGVEHGVKGLFDTVFYKIFQFGVDKILVYLYNVIRHSSFLLRILCVVTQLYLMEWTMSFLYYKFAQLIIPYRTDSLHKGSFLWVEGKKRPLQSVTIKTVYKTH